MHLLKIIQATTLQSAHTIKPAVQRLPLRSGRLATSKRGFSSGTAHEMASESNNVCLIVIDGWGVLKEKHGNAIANGNTPVMDRLCGGNNMDIEAHGLHVGLPEGLMGNSEVGHLNIGAGRVIYQDIVRINMSVTVDPKDPKSMFVNKGLKDACDNAKAKNGRLHLLGLVSDGGVHSHIDHLFGMLKAVKHHAVPKCFVQFFGDGRDTSPHSGIGFAEQLLKFLDDLGYGTLASVTGRYYAMDRDKRWERLKIAYEGLVGGIGERTTKDKLLELYKERYAKDETDEFLKPILVGDEEGRIKENDTLVFFDYRADRMRQISMVFGLERNFTTEIKHPPGMYIACMTRYDASYPFPLLFPPVSHENVLAEWLMKQKKTQFHCAETEKYAHVTFFFNGGREQQFEGEERCLVPSPKVATYDLQPEMSCGGVADKMCEMIKSKKHPFVMCNFAPPDMVGHTGIYEAAVKACTATDAAIGRVEQACKEAGYILLITSDHGNAEQMYDPQGGKHTAHTCNLVPFASSGKRRVAKKLGRAPALCDVAPTVLDYMGLPKPDDMGGESLLAD